MESLLKWVNVGGGIIGWYQSFPVQTLGLDGLNVIFMHACHLSMCLVFMNCYGYGYYIYVRIDMFVMVYHANMDWSMQM